jgi:hypothetical protein
MAASFLTTVEWAEAGSTATTVLWRRPGAISGINWMKYANVDKGLTKGDADRHVDAKGPNRGAAGKRLAFENGTNPPEMPLPILAAWIKKTDDFAGLRIDARQIWAFVEITWHTSVCAIWMGIYASMHLCDDVIELERQVVIRLRHLAIFATVVCPLTNQILGSFVHVDQEVVVFILPRILAFKMDRRCPTWT